MSQMTEEERQLLGASGATGSTGPESTPRRKRKAGDTTGTGDQGAEQGSQDDEDGQDKPEKPEPSYGGNYIDFTDAVQVDVEDAKEQFPAQYTWDTEESKDSGDQK